MTNKSLALDYYKKAKARIKALYTLRDEEAYSDVVRESQEVVELLLKGLLRIITIDPPKWHDVSSLLTENKELLSKKIVQNLDRIQKLSQQLRKERELSFYGDDDFLPTENYNLEIANFYIQEVEWLFELLKSEFK